MYYSKYVHIYRSTYLLNNEKHEYVNLHGRRRIPVFGARRGENTCRTKIIYLF